MRRSIRRTLGGFFAVWGEEHGLTVLLGLLLVNFFLVPLLSPQLARYLSALGFSLILLAGAATLSGRRVARGFVTAVVISALLLRWLAQVLGDPNVSYASTAALLLFLVLLTGHVLHRVFRRGPVTPHRIRGAIAAYFLFGLCWAMVYQLIAGSHPGAFSFPAAEAGRVSHDTTLSYFSFVTLTTLGYGDVTPVHPVARMFVVLEALVGQLYPATLLARLVSLELMYRELPAKDGESAAPAEEATAAPLPRADR